MRLPPPVPGKPLIVHVVVNVEYWPFEQPMPRKLLPGPHGNDKIPDVPNFSWVEYGMRTGFPRILHALKRRGLPASTTINASVIDVYPRVAESMLDAGWEFMGHGWTQKALQNEPDEGAGIDRCMERIQRFTGLKMRGWLGAGLSETMDTPDVLKSRGVDYVCDWVIDDLPQDIATPHGTMTTVPYSVETNDIVIHALQHLPSEQFLKRCTDQFDRLYLEGDTNARFMAISVHPYITGVPHRIKYLEALLDYVIGHDGVALMTASEIGDWYRAEMSKAK